MIVCDGEKKQFASSSTVLLPNECNHSSDRQGKVSGSHIEQFEISGRQKVEV